MTTPRRRYTLEGRLGSLIVRGATLRADVAEAVLSASLDLGIGEVPQLTLTVFDPRLELVGSRLFVPGTPATAGSQLDYGDLRLECRAISVNEGGTVTVTARDLAAYKLKRLRNAVVRRNMSRTQAVALDAAAVGLRYIGEASARVPSLARESGESAWDSAQRWAKELGYLCFLSGRTLYFGRVTWLLSFVARDPSLRRRIAWKGDGSTGTDNALVSRPVCRRSGDDDNADAQISAKLLGAAGDRFAPGNIAWLTGVPTFDGLYVVNRVRMELDDHSPVQVEGITPRNLVPAPPPVPTPAGTVRTPQRTPIDDDGPRPAGRGTAAAMVEVALGQAGTRYVFGAEASAADSDPDAFDCSELVEWACARVGVRFVDGSSNQRAAVRRIPVEQGIRTRGALLFHPGHVAISLGDGRTIEASNRRYPVRTTSARGRFDAAGLIPGLRY